MSFLLKIHLQISISVPHVELQKEIAIFMPEI